MEETGVGERYHRQLILDGFGPEAQQKLGRARVLVAGAGGLGCPVLSYLTAAGVGTIGIADDGLVELSNLHRQVLYGTGDLGQSKTACAKRALNRLNPAVHVRCHPLRLAPSNCLEILEDYDVVIDGLDTLEGKYMLNDACVLLGKPLIFGAITRFEGQVAVWNAPGAESAHYRDLFPEPPGREETRSCSEAGVLGILPGIIGSFQANECIKLLTGLGAPLVNRLLTYDALTCAVYLIDVSPSPAGKSGGPPTKEAFKDYVYDRDCEPAGEIAEIDAARLKALLSAGNADLVDVREAGECPPIRGAHLHIPLAELSRRSPEIKKDTVIFVCRSGQRSRVAARRFVEMATATRHIFSLRGGLEGTGDTL